MKLKMLKTMNGSPDGLNVYEYEIGKTYDVTESLYKVFTNEIQCAVSCENPLPKAVSDNDKIVPKASAKKAKEVKSEEQAPENKDQASKKKEDKILDESETKVKDENENEVEDESKDKTKSKEKGNSLKSKIPFFGKNK